VHQSLLYIFTCCSDIFGSISSYYTSIQLPGQDATLQCWGPRDAHITLLEWSRPEPELISQGYVFFFQDQRSYENYQHESFKGRVELRDSSMKDGDVSAILRNVSVSDTGTYDCQITTIQINITAGQNVILPCRAPNIDSNSKAVVEWSRADLGKDYVLLYRDEQPDPEEQHPSFKNRVDLQDRQMKDGDVSLILKDVTINDTGTYECRVFRRRTNRRKRLDVTELIVNPGQDAPLQCQGPRDAEITLLEWNRADLKSDDYVFLYRNQRPYENYQHESFKGRVKLMDPSMKDGNVSVTLRNVKLNDTGTYKCQITTKETESVVHDSGQRIQRETRQSINLTVTDSGELRGSLYYLFFF
uniref:Ig-like domain-containing protein n=1 Tax=Neolamprologus brichardi TaxID=32507 RepID=A0A3Q4G6Z1_NEOBR